MSRSDEQTVQATERPRSAPHEPRCLARRSARTCELAITRSHHRTVPVMTEHFVWPAQILLDSTHWYRTVAAVSGR